MTATTIEEGKRVTWAELYFDLVFVFAVTRVSVLVHDDHSWAGLGKALVVFLLVYWAWVGTTIQSNAFDMETSRNRLVLFAIALCGLVMALSVTQAYDDRGLVFAFGYWLARLVLGFGLFNRSRTALTPYTVSMYITGPALVVGASLQEAPRVWVWTACALLDVAMPTIQRRRLASLHFDAGHLTERFGLFVLIALGESIVAIGAPIADADHLDAAEMIAVIVAFLLTVGLWWVYFHLAANAMRYALATADVQFRVTRHVLSYAHLSFIWAIILVAVGTAETVSHPTERMSWTISALLMGGCSLFLATFGYTRWMMFRLVSRTRLGGAAAALILLPVSLLVPAVVTLGSLVVVLACVNGAELRKVHLARRVVPGGR